MSLIYLDMHCILLMLTFFIISFQYFLNSVGLLFCF